MMPSEQRARAEQQALRENLRRYGPELMMREAIASAALSYDEDDPDVPPPASEETA